MQEAEALPVGGAGVLALDYFMGNRTPYRDPLLRGAFLGLSLGHDRAALYRAAVEGVALASANVLKRMTVAAVCVYPTMVGPAVKALEGSGIPVASVATGFPAGLTPLKQRLDEIRYAVGEGAREIDIVITRAHVLSRDWNALYDEVAAMREACGSAHLKTILGTGDLKTLRNVYAASMVAMQAGADFIKTSTGKEDVNATLPVSLVMLRALRDYRERSGVDIGFKPAGGLRTAKDALAWLILMKEELGLPWMQPDLFRIGASGLLTDIERQLDHYTTGRYSAAHRHAMA